jgi:peptidyl-prolyl cis-trans isomerase B (cyclophilin B)
MKMRITSLGLVALVLSATATAAQERGNGQIEATITAKARHINAGDPIMVEFLIRNVSHDPVTLFVPGTDPVAGGDAMGLPLEHVFSGEAFGALTVRNADNRSWDVAVGYQPPGEAAIVVLAPHSTIGTTVDVREYYRALRAPGRYWLKWAPYGGSVESNTLYLQIETLKQAIITTDLGEMTMRFLYGEAPNHIDNFIELVKKGFYNNLTFHRIESGYFIQGGCPSGDGTGIRPDGIKLEEEFSSRPQKRGSVNMALLGDDPDSASCQFFIVNTRVPHWDGKYTTFGEIVGETSFETLDKLMAIPTDELGTPTQKTMIRSIRIVEAPRVSALDSVRRTHQSDSADQSRGDGDASK